MSKSPSQMNKKELYEHCKILQEELHKEKLFQESMCVDFEELRVAYKKEKETNKILKLANDTLSQTDKEGLQMKIKLLEENKQFKKGCCEMEDKLVQQQQSYEDLYQENKKLKELYKNEQQREHTIIIGGFHTFKDYFFDTLEDIVDMDQYESYKGEDLTMDDMKSIIRDIKDRFMSIRELC